MTDKQTRSNAAQICALSASSGKGQHITARWLRSARHARALAKDAYDYVVWATRWASPRHSWCELNAEAEAMLRRGWPHRDGTPLHD